MTPAHVLLDSLDAGGEVIDAFLELREPTFGVVRATLEALLRCCTVPYTLPAPSLVDPCQCTPIT